MAAKLKKRAAKAAKKAKKKAIEEAKKLKQAAAAETKAKKTEPFFHPAPVPRNCSHINIREQRSSVESASFRTSTLQRFSQWRC